MSRYIDQDLFDLLAINIAWMRRVRTGDRSANQRAEKELLVTDRRSGFALVTALEKCNLETLQCRRLFF